MSMALPSPAPTPDGVAPTPGGPPPALGDADQAAVRAQVEGLLLRITQDLYEMEICAGDVGQGMENAVPTYLAKINAGLLELQQASARLGDSVPKQIIEQIDQFRNPHTYTKNTLSRSTGENQYALGRVLGLETFRRELHDAVENEFPGLPLPPRRHQPVLPDPPEEQEVKAEEVKEEGGVQINGDGGETQART